MNDIAIKAKTRIFGIYFLSRFSSQAKKANAKHDSLRKLFFDFGFTDIYDFPNLRCKDNFFYTNKFKYFIASKLPFLGLTSRIVPKILK